MRTYIIISLKSVDNNHVGIKTYWHSLGRPKYLYSIQTCTFCIKHSSEAVLHDSQYDYFGIDM